VPCRRVKRNANFWWDKMRPVMKSTGFKNA
jgi:hypothetical protein